MTERLLWIGLDAADDSSVGTMMRAGRMPNLSDLVEMGRSCSLRSTVLPITPGAWAAAYTGMNPGKTGILTWQLARRDYHARVVNQGDIGAAGLHVRIPAAGKQLVSIGFPLTSPPPAGGLVFTGWDAPQSAPKSNDERWEKRLPEFGYRVEDEFSLDEATQAENVRAHFRLARAIDRERTWDCLMMYFAFIDHFGHRLGADNDVTLRVLEVFDAELGAFVQTLRDTPIFMLNSDHGFGSFTRSFSVVQWLSAKGYLALDSHVVAQRADAAPGLESVDLDLKIDWTRTRAFCTEAIGSFAGIRLNVAGTLPQGIVAPRDAWQLGEELRGRLLECRDGDERIVKNVWRREELYWGPHVDELPELFVECAADTTMLFGKWRQEEGALHLEEDHYIHRGTFNSHRPDGLWLSSFPCEGELNVEDIAPTVYALLGMPVPGDVDGQNRSGRETGSGVAATPPAQAYGDQNAYTPDEEELVRKRLEALGYL